MRRALIAVACLVVGCGSADDGRGRAELVGGDAAPEAAPALPAPLDASPGVDAGEGDAGASDASDAGAGARVVCAVSVACAAPQREACGDCLNHADCVCVSSDPDATAPGVDASVDASDAGTDAGVARSVCAVSVACAAPQREACGDCLNHADCVCVSPDAG